MKPTADHVDVMGKARSGAAFTARHQRWCHFGSIIEVRNALC